MVMDGSEFIGRGWRFPPRINERGGIMLVSGTDEVEGAMRMILLTAPGERVMRPEFGCRAWDYIFAPLDANTTGAIQHAVREALARWEPRVTVEDVRAYADPDREATVSVSVEYRVNGSNDRRNLVVPFYEIGEEPS